MFLKNTEGQQSHDFHMKEHDELLMSARDYYWDAFIIGRSDSWAVVQYLSLTIVMQKCRRFGARASLWASAADGREERDPAALWSLAHLLTLYDLNSKERSTRIWAHGNIIELYLLASVMGPGDGRPDQDEARNRALRYTDQLVDIAGRDTFEVYSTRRQILRYLEWFGGPKGFSDIGEFAYALAKDIFKRLPEEGQEKW